MNTGEKYRYLFDRAVDSGVSELITFGSYPVSSDGRKAPVLWKRLTDSDGKILLVSEMCIDVLPYEEKGTSITWEECSLRKYLNTVMLNEMFSEEEQRLITETKNENPDNIYFHTKGGEPSAGGRETTDRIFLLSADETEKYFAEGRNKAARLTEYACSKCHESVSAANSASYWLRGPGMRQNLAVYVRPDGAVEHTGYHTDCRDFAIRPAIWVNASDPKYKHLVKYRLGSTAESGSHVEEETERKPSPKLGLASIISGAAGILLPLIVLIMILTGADTGLPLLILISVVGLFAGIFGIGSGISSGNRAGLILSIIAVVLNLLLLGMVFYLRFSHIWDLSQYL